MDAALAYTATILQSPFLIDYAGKTWDEPRGQDSVGAGPLQRAYRANNGWLFIGARDAAALDAVEGLGGVGSTNGAALASALEGRFATAGAEEWVSRLTAADVGAHHVVSSTDELMELPWAIDHGLSITRDHEILGKVTSIGPAARLSKAPVRPGPVAPVLGQHSIEILREVGLGDRAEAVIASGGVLAV